MICGPLRPVRSSLSPARSSPSSASPSRTRSIEHSAPSGTRSAGRENQRRSDASVGSTVVTETYAAQNAAETPENRYLFDPEQRCEPIETVEEASRDVVSFYRSHPTGPLPLAPERHHLPFELVRAVAPNATGRRTGSRRARK
jgi:proteasome lid subunit RPN8/RPN11